MPPPPSIQETVLSLQWLKNNKSLGAVGIPAELIKYGGDQLHRAVHNLMLKLWGSEKMLEFDLKLHHLFIDFKAAYESVAKVKLYPAMREFDIPTKLIRG